MKHGSLFSGLGGFDLAAEWMGWENIFHCEWMDFPRKVLDYYWPNADSHVDICKTDFKKYANKIDILTGGFPCQPFSMAGKRKGTEDERYLWGEMLRAIQEIKPKFVIAENVFGITNIDGGMVFEQVCLDLENQGYEVQPYIIPAAAKNAPHRRDRVWFIAYNNGIFWGEGREFKSRKQSRHGESNESCNTKIDGNATDPNSNGFNKCNSNDEKQSSERRKYAQRNFEQSDVNGTATNPKSNGWEKFRSGTNKREEHKQKGSSVWSELTTISKIRNAPNSKNIRRKDALENGELEGRRFRFGDKPHSWDTFPLESPICGGDDGLPTELDGITFSKWRAESIKGYGNAIVPQVALEIFKALEKL